LEKFCEQGEGVAEEAIPDEFPPLPPFPVPFLKQLAFSYSGLHSAVDRFLLSAQKVTPPTKTQEPASPVPSRPGSNLPTSVRRALARAFQTGAVTQLEEKVILALRWCKEQQKDGVASMSIDNDGCKTSDESGVGMVKHVVVSGGVASNMFLRKRYALYRVLCEQIRMTEHTRIDFKNPLPHSSQVKTLPWSSHRRPYAQITRR
jgi:N6-L-threonylcarbamoyladenine synthase